MILSEEQMRQMKEDDLREKVLHPLMEAMGYRGVFEWHGGAGELGKDLVGWKENDLRNRRNRAVVAKADRISGVQAVGIATTQVRQAFNTPFADPSTGEEQRVHECWLVTNQRLGKEAREAIRSALPPEREPYVEILDGDDLWREVKNRLPIELYQVLDEAQQRLERIDEGYGAQVWLGKSGHPFAYMATEDRGIAMLERYPGQLGEEPFVISGNLVFPDTPEGRAKFEEYKSALMTGARVHLPGEYLDLKFPEAMKRLSEQLLGVRIEEIFTLEMTSAPNPRRIPVSIDIECEDGDSATIHYVEWRVIRAGTDEITLSNDEQSVPYLVTQVLNLREQTGNFTISRKEGAIAAPVLLQILWLMKCFSKPCTVRVTTVDTDLLLSVSRRHGSSEEVVDPTWLALVADLAAVQQRVGRPILIPDRDFTDDEWDTIRLLRTLLRTPEVETKWSKLEWSWAAKDAEQMLGHFALGEQQVFRPTVELGAKLFATEISLGKVRLVYEDIRLANEEEVRGQLAVVTDPDTDIRFRFEPGTNDKVWYQYLDWGADPGPPGELTNGQEERSPS